MHTPTTLLRMTDVILHRPAWVDAYIEALRVTGLEATARGIAQVSKRAVDNLLADDLEFSSEVSDTLDQWADKLEREAYRRGVEGIEKGIYYKGKLEATEIQYSDTLLQTLLKAKRPDQFGDKKQITGAGGQPLTVHIRTFAPPSSDSGAYLPAIEGELIEALLDEIEADDLA